MTVLFLHIPKTAGTSLDTGWLQPRFCRTQRFCETDLFDRDQLVRRHVFAQMEHISKHFNFHYADVFEFFAEQGLVPLDRTYYAGHVCFGIHGVLDRPCRYVTLLRHPVGRIVSYYNLVHSLGHFTGTFDDFLNSGRYEIDNYQVRCLCLEGWTAQHVTQAMLEEAQDNLVRYCLFGVTERMADSIRLIASGLGIPGPATPLHLNQTKEAAPIHCGAGKKFQGTITSISPAERSAILDLNPLGVKLHAFATKQLEGHRPVTDKARTLPWGFSSWFRKAG